MRAPAEFRDALTQKLSTSVPEAVHQVILGKQDRPLAGRGVDGLMSHGTVCDWSGRGIGTI